MIVILFTPQYNMLYNDDQNIPKEKKNPRNSRNVFVNYKR